ncbi:MAG: hypothetical protein AAB674_02670 [Patescibacteria group bacterium]
MNKKIIYIALLALPIIGFAQMNIPGLNPPQTGITSINDVNTVIVRIVNWVMGIFFVAAVLFIFWAAYLYLTAAGDTEKVSKAHNQLIYSIVAIAVALLAGSMRYIVANLLGA